MCLCVGWGGVLLVFMLQIICVFICKFGIFENPSLNRNSIVVCVSLSLHVKRIARQNDSLTIAQLDK